MSSCTFRVSEVARSRARMSSTGNLAVDLDDGPDFGPLVVSVYGEPGEMLSWAERLHASIAQAIEARATTEQVESSLSPDETRADLHDAGADDPSPLEHYDGVLDEARGAA